MGSCDSNRERINHVLLASCLASKPLTLLISAFCRCLISWRTLVRACSHTFSPRSLPPNPDLNLAQGPHDRCQTFVPILSTSQGCSVHAWSSMRPSPASLCCLSLRSVFRFGMMLPTCFTGSVNHGSAYGHLFVDLPSCSQTCFRAATSIFL